MGGGQVLRRLNLVFSRAERDVSTSETAVLEFERDVFELHDEAKEKVTTTQRGMNSSAVSLVRSTSMPKVYMNAATLIWRTYQHYRARKEVSRHDSYFENKGVVTYPEILNP